MPESLTVNEIFRSIQGEGTRAGLPCTFVRLTGCDLRCVWCDTEYAFHEGRRMSVGEVVEQVRALACGLVELTGGEPLLQPAVLGLMQVLVDDGFTVMLETGGHRDISAVDPRVIRIVDLKCPGSGQEAANRWENIALLRPGDEVKFVIANRADYDWAREVVRRHELCVRCPVLFSPAHGLLEAVELAEWILADGLGVRLQLQLHKLIWSPQRRGV